MEDDSVDPETPDGGTDEGTVPKSELKKAIAARQKAKADKDAALARLAEREAKLAEYEAKEKEADKARLRAAEDWAALEKQLTAERDDALATLEGERKSIRRGAMLDAVVAATGRSRRSISDMMAGASMEAQYKDLDWAPEVLSEKAVETVVKALKKRDPEAFKDQPRGGTPGAIGNPQEEDDMAARIAKVEAMAKKYSS